MATSSPGHSLGGWRLWLAIAVLLALAEGNTFIQPTEVARSASSLPSPSSQLGDSPFGMVTCLGNRYPDLQERALAVEKMAGAGVRWQREEFTWVEVEPQRGNFQWDKYDQAVEQQIAAGISLVGLLDYGAAWWGDRGTDKDMSPLSDEQLNEWTSFVQNVVGRYGGRIHYWEIWNEENIDTFWAPRPNAADYVRLLEVSYRAITDVTSGSQVLMGGTSSVDLDFIQQVYDLGGESYFDILAVHPYQPANPEGADPASSEFVDVLTRLHTRFPDKPIWLTEVGWSTADWTNWPWAVEAGGETAAELVQASYLVRMYVQALALPQVEKVLWYDFRNDNTGDSHEDSFGLVHSDSAMHPKQSYLAYQNMSSLLEGAVFERQVRGPKIDSGSGLGDDVYEYRFSRGGESIVVLWKSRGGSTPRSIIVDDVQATTATLIRLSGDSQSIPVSNQEVTVDLTEEPLYLVFGQGVTPPPSGLAASATVLLTDVSGSMGEDWQGGIKIESAKAATVDIINMIEQESQVGASNHQVAIATFTSDAYLDLGLTTDYNVARQVVNGLSPLERTNIGAGLQVSNQALISAPAGAKKIIILLSGGLTNEGLPPGEILDGPVQEAVSAGTCIHTIGFGDPGNLDEQLLREIAARTGCGEYSYASAPAELKRIYIRLRHQSLAQILGKFEGQVAQGEQVDAGEVNVPAGQGELYASLYRPGSVLGLVMTDPLGQVVDENYPGATIFTYPRMVYAVVDDPLAGMWDVNVFGEDVPAGTTRFDTVISSRVALVTPVPPPVPTEVPTVTPPSVVAQPAGGIGPALIFLVIVIGAVALLVLNATRGRLRTATAGVPGVARPRLIIRSGRLAGREFPLGAQGLTIGRGRDNDVQLEGSTVSQRHAAIRSARGRFFLQDQGSTHGTYLRGQRVEAAPLSEGDVIRVGDVDLEFRAQ